MKKYKQVQVEKRELVSVTCDKCKKEYDDIMEMQEFLHYDNDAGYGSIMGDGNRLRLDLCQHCTHELLGSFIRTEGNYIWSGDELEDSKMDPKHNHLNDLLAEDFFAQSSFKGDKDD